MKSVGNQKFDWRCLSDETAYQAWRSDKLRSGEAALGRGLVSIRDFANPSESERKELILRCSKENLSCYALERPSGDPEETRRQLRSFAAALGLKIAESHRSAGEAGIVALQVTDAPRQAGYIPYTPRPLSWHTDGYYNAPEDRVNAFVLHCVRPAAEGGENMLLDPEIAYIRLRDADPAYVGALMQDAAMTIPEDATQKPPRPASVGPVFYGDPATGRLQMRYTARTRSISWYPDAVTQEASDYLRSLLEAGDPLSRHLRLAAGQGVLNNNALHNRTAFRNGGSEAETRLIYRVRFHNRLEEA